MKWLSCNMRVEIVEGWLSLNGYLSGIIFLLHRRFPEVIHSYLRISFLTVSLSMIIKISRNKLGYHPIFEFFITWKLTWSWKVISYFCIYPEELLRLIKMINDNSFTPEILLAFMWMQYSMEDWASLREHILNRKIWSNQFDSLLFYSP